MNEFTQPRILDAIRANFLRKLSGELTQETYEEANKLITPVVVRAETEEPRGDISPEGYGSGSWSDREPNVASPRQDQGNPSDRGQHPDAAKGKSQKQRLLALLQDHEAHTTIEIMTKVYRVGEDRGIARIASRINDLRNDGHKIETIRITQTLTAYKLV